MKNQLLEKLFADLYAKILSNPWTSLVGVVAILALAYYSKQLTTAQIVNFVLLAFLGVGSQDGGSASKEDKNELV